MSGRVPLCAGVGIAALAFGLAPVQAWAQAEASPAPARPQAQNDAEIIVSGIRQSVLNAIERKRDSNQIMDSIVADDIGKLPDLTAVDALQRVPGVSITRDRGEGNGARIRGLGLVLSTIDGREAFTADGGRGYNLQDMPAELLGAIDVYKTPQANQIEGGVTGIIDMRTRLPFDFKNTTFSGNFRLRYADLADAFSPIVSGLFSTRWETGIGEMGFLIAGVDQRRTFRSDVPAWNAAVSRSDVVPGKDVYLTSGDYETSIYGKRHRPGINTAFQWRPAPNFDFYAQAGFQSFSSKQQQYGLNVPLNAAVPARNQNTVVPGSVSLFPGTNDVEKVSFNNLTGVFAFGVERDTKDSNQQYAVGFKWELGNHHIALDASYMKSSNDLYYTELDLDFTPAVTTFDYGKAYPSVTFSGTDLLNPANYKYGKLSLNVNHYKGDSPALRIDDDIHIDNSFLTNIKVGGRINKRTLEFFDPVRFNKSTQNTSLAANPDLYQQMPFDDFISSGAATTHAFLVANPSRLGFKDFDDLRGILGVTSPVTTTPQSEFKIGETVKAGYVQLLFANENGLAFDGNVGVRYVNTKLDTDSFIRDSATGQISPYNQGNSYTDWLPSVNVRLKPMPDLFIRLAYSRTLTRPTTQQLAPSYTLVPATGRGSGGNPNLKPLRSRAFDISIEKYFGDKGSVFFAAFDRHVTNFIFSSTVPGVVIDGVPYEITTPVNGRYGKIRGFETGGQTFFDFLPGILSGLGAQANYTYIHSETDQVVPGSKTALTGVPKHSLAGSLLYEKGGLGMRLSYTWRSTVFTSVYNNPANAIGVGRSFAEGYDWLDGSISYDFNKNWTASLEFSNITGTNIRSNRGGDTRPGDYNRDDRQILLGVRFKY